VARAIRKTIEYAKLFQYPLQPNEIRERLFDVKVDPATFDEVMTSLRYQPDPELLAVRAEREQISDRGILEVQPHLRRLASMPFLRMLALSGSTAHRNMNTTEDIDLFLIVEDGKLWAVFLIAVLWAKVKGLRKRLCMNYLISDRALPLFEHDLFTAQQVASLKPMFGKTVYDRFIEANSFVSRSFPNFDAAGHRDAYAEIKPYRSKRFLEAVLRFGPVQVLDWFSQFVVGRYLSGKINATSDVLLDRRRLKLHLHSHKKAVLDQAGLS
jgi:hypothetical protein